MEFLYRHIEMDATIHDIPFMYLFRSQWTCYINWNKLYICIEIIWYKSAEDIGHAMNDQVHATLREDFSAQRPRFWSRHHYGDFIIGPIASEITSLTIVYSTVYSDADQRKHQSSASLAFVWGIHREPVNSPHKWPVTRKMFPFDDVIM